MLMVAKNRDNTVNLFEELSRVRSMPAPSTRALCLDYQVSSTLPRLGWAALVTPGQNTVRMMAGEDVSRDGNVFWEGLCLSPDDPGATLDHPFPVSTGGMVRADDVAFWTPGHYLDRLFLVKTAAGVVVSNSLPFALRASGETLAADYLHYPWDFGRILQHSQSAPLTRGRVQIITNANLLVSRDGEIKVVPKAAPPEFHDYASYIGQVHAFLDEVAHANQAQLDRPYRYVSSLSSGYDSPAVTVLGRRIGLTDALSIIDSRGGTAGDDSGEPIAAALGLSLKTALRSDYRAAGWDAERLFYVFGLPEDICLHPFRNDLKRSLLFTGILGETQWDRVPHYAGGCWSWDPGGATMQEFRLRTGFAQLPLAFYGWQHNAQLVRISQSAELEPWSLGNSYDRPIARRLVEECGVPRECFGMKKRAVSIMVGVHHHGYVDETALGMSSEMAERLDAHAQSVAGLKTKMELSLSNGLHDLVRFAHESAHALKKKKSAQVRPGQNNTESMAWKAMFNADRMFPLRRKYMAPFSNLNFSTQVANASLADDYLTFDD